MASLREIAEHHIGSDPFLQEAVNRGIVNARGLARWLKEHRGVEAEDEALANPIREIQSEAEGSSVEEASELLASARVYTVEGRTLLVIERDDRIEQKLSRLVSEQNLRSDEFWFSTGKNTIRIVLDDEVAEDAIKQLDTVLVGDPVRELVELQVRAGSGREGMRLLGMGIVALAALGIDVVEVNHDEKIQSIVVRNEDKERAWRIFGDHVEHE